MKFFFFFGKFGIKMRLILSANVTLHLKICGYFQISFGVDFSHNSTVIREWTLFSIPTPLDHEIFAPGFMSLDMFQCLLVFIDYGDLNKTYILLFCENCMNPNYVELVHGAFQVSCIFVLFCILILLIFESLILKLQLKILLFLLKK